MRPERMIEYTAGTHAKQGNHGSEAIWSAVRRPTLGARACTNIAVARRVPTPTAQARAARPGSAMSRVIRAASPSASAAIHQPRVAPARGDTQQGGR